MRGRAGRATAWGLLASLAVHLGGYGLLRTAATLPDIDIELAIPSEIELGFADATPLPSPATTPAATPPVVDEAPPAPEDLDDGPDPETRSAPADAAVAELPEPTRDAGEVASPPATDGPPRDAGVGTAAADAGTPLLAAFAPEGAQLALRLDLARLRTSALATEVGALLAVVPDWQLVLDGSGLDPLEDLERLFIASPDLSRSKMVVAGEYARPGLAQLAVARLAKARGVEAPWRTEAGYAVAPWANADETARVVTLLGEQQFAITRPEDLGRVIAIAAGLEARTPDAGTGGDALLALGQDEIVVFTAEGARAYVRTGQRAMVPIRLRVGVAIATEQEPSIHVAFEASYDDEREASQAQDFWDSLRQRFASHPLVAFARLSAPLGRAEIVREEGSLSTRIELTTEQASKVLTLASGLLAPPPPPPPLPSKPRTGPKVPSRPTR